MENGFILRIVNEKIILEKGNESLCIYQTPDNDVWFTTSIGNLSFNLNKYSDNLQEWKIYLAFERLMKLIIGRYILNGENKKEFSILPEDFVDLDNNVIICHSDGEDDNILKLSCDQKTIKVEMSNSKETSKNVVRIRTSGSSYGYYYQEFLDFFGYLIELEGKMNKQAETIELNNIDNSGQKKLSLFKV